MNIINENMMIIKEFRVLYKPFERDYEVKYDTPVTAATKNIFSYQELHPIILKSSES